MTNIIDYGKQFRVLAIGNSFSEDAMQYLYDIANDYGIKEIIVGNLYIPGAPLEKHVEEIKENLNDYIYFKNTNGKWIENYNTKLLAGLKDEDWDVISLQQVSHYSGMKDTYNEDLDFLIDYVKSNRSNKQGLLVWHKTWAYQNDSDHGGFAFYDQNQMKMYDSILKAVEEKILPKGLFSYVIPSGTAIQNLRTSYLGDTLTRDGFHLSYDIGRFTAAMCWFLKITGFDIDNVDFRPEGVNESEASLVKKAVKAAVKNPFQITEIKYE